MDKLATAMASLAASVVHQWRSQSERTASLAISNFSVGRLRVCRLGNRIFAARGVDPFPRRAPFSGRRCFRCRPHSGRPLAGLPAAAPLCHLRFLAHESGLFPDPCGIAVHDSLRELCLVPLGTGAMGLQPVDSVRTDFPFGVLGAYRICLWARVDSLEARTGYSERERRTTADFSGNVSAVAGKDEAEGSRRQAFVEGRDSLLAATSSAASRSDGAAPVAALEERGWLVGTPGSQAPLFPSNGP